MIVPGFGSVIGKIKITGGSVRRCPKCRKPMMFAGRDVFCPDRKCEARP